MCHTGHCDVQGLLLKRRPGVFLKSDDIIRNGIRLYTFTHAPSFAVIYIFKVSTRWWDCSAELLYWCRTGYPGRSHETVALSPCRMFASSLKRASCWGSRWMRQKGRQTPPDRMLPAPPPPSPPRAAPEIGVSVREHEPVCWMKANPL